MHSLYSDLKMYRNVLNFHSVNSNVGGLVLILNNIKMEFHKVNMFLENMHV